MASLHHDLFHPRNSNQLPQTPPPAITIPDVDNLIIHTPFCIPDHHHGTGVTTHHYPSTTPGNVVTVADGGHQFHVRYGELGQPVFHATANKVQRALTVYHQKQQASFVCLGSDFISILLMTAEPDHFYLRLYHNQMTSPPVWEVQIPLASGHGLLMDMQCYGQHQQLLRKFPARGQVAVPSLQQQLQPRT